MGNHRADRRGLGRRPSVTSTPAVGGKRVATPPANRAASVEKREAAAPPKREPAAPTKRQPAAPHKHAAVAPAKRSATAPVTRDAADTTELAPVETVAGRRKASRHSVQRGSLLRGFPSAPIAMGIAALAVSAGGAVTAANPALMGASADDVHVNQASALGGETGVSSTNLLNQRRAAVSRDSRRDALADAADQDLVEQAEMQAQERNAALARFAKQAEQQAAKIALNQWVLPVEGYHLTARFGDYGLWSSYHTGLDFAAPTGTPIHAIANGVITSASYDGSYGNKTVLTLEDGTELWFCHQTEFDVSVGDVVQAGDVIGSIGSTGNVTGPHLHLEVRPGAGDPVDPYAALVVHGLQP
jgi:murein DD-endopeptidase MepM/ murein hydrolase activator NlpD